MLLLLCWLIFGPKLRYQMAGPNQNNLLLGEQFRKNTRHSNGGKAVITERLQTQNGQGKDPLQDVQKNRTQTLA